MPWLLPMIAQGSGYYFHWRLWIPDSPVINLLLAGLVFPAVLSAGWGINRIFSRVLQRYDLTRVLRQVTLLMAGYLALWFFNYQRMEDTLDLGSIWIHRIFLAGMLISGLRALDRLAIIPLLTRGGRLALSRFVHQVVMIIIWSFAILYYANWAFNLNIDRILAGSAVISIVLGLALQETLGNFFSGMVMQASTPFAPGNWIQCGGAEGRVVDMTWRSVTLHTIDDNLVLIPNSLIAKEKIINFSVPSAATARLIRVGLENRLPPHLVQNALFQAVRETPGVLKDPAPLVLLDDFADANLVYRVKYWMERPEEFQRVDSAVRVRIWYRLQQQGQGIHTPLHTQDRLNAANANSSLLEEELAGLERRRRLLDGVEFLAPFSSEQRRELARRAVVLHWATGEAIYRQNDLGGTFFILESGRVEIQIPEPQGPPLILLQWGPGECFGEFSALSGHPRSAQALATEPSVGLEISLEMLQEFFDKDAALLDKVSQIAAQRHAQRVDRLRQLAPAHPDLQPAKAFENTSVQEHQQTLLSKMRRIFSRLDQGAGL